MPFSPSLPHASPIVHDSVLYCASEDEVLLMYEVNPMGAVSPLPLAIPVYTHEKNVTFCV